MLAPFDQSLHFFNTSNINPNLKPGCKLCKNRMIFKFYVTGQQRKWHNTTDSTMMVKWPASIWCPPDRDWMFMKTQKAPK
jgi:hypothetical protein